MYARLCLLHTHIPVTFVGPTSGPPFNASPLSDERSSLVQLGDPFEPYMDRPLGWIWNQGVSDHWFYLRTSLQVCWHSVHLFSVKQGARLAFNIYNFSICFYSLIDFVSGYCIWTWRFRVCIQFSSRKYLWRVYNINITLFISRFVTC